MARFSGAPSEAPTDPHELLARLEKEVFPNNLHVDHPRFFAFVPGPGNFVSTMADALAPGFNVFNGTWLGGSAAAAIELTVIDWFRRLLRFSGNGRRTFCQRRFGGEPDRASRGTMRETGRSDSRRDDLFLRPDPLLDRTRASRDRVRPEQSRKIPSNDRFQLPLESLRAAIRADKSRGLRPFCVVANAGTTNTGAVDPLSDLADVCVAERPLAPRRWRLRAGGGDLRARPGKTGRSGSRRFAFARSPQMALPAIRMRLRPRARCGAFEIRVPVDARIYARRSSQHGGNQSR